MSEHRRYVVVVGLVSAPFGPDPSGPRTWGKVVHRSRHSSDGMSAIKRWRNAVLCWIELGGEVGAVVEVDAVAAPWTGCPMRAREITPLEIASVQPAPARGAK